MLHELKIMNKGAYHFPLLTLQIFLSQKENFQSKTFLPEKDITLIMLKPVKYLS